MDEWPDIVIDDEDDVLEETVVLSDDEVAAVERELTLAMQVAADKLAVSLKSLTNGITLFAANLRRIHDDHVLSQTLLFQREGD